MSLNDFFKQIVMTHFGVTQTAIHNLLFVLLKYQNNSSQYSGKNYWDSFHEEEIVKKKQSCCILTSSTDLCLAMHRYAQCKLK